MRPKFVPRSDLPTRRDVEYSENTSSFLTARSADWTLLGDVLQPSVYFDRVWMRLPDTGLGPDRSVSASPRQQEIKLCENEGRAIWMPERKVKMSSGNRRGELTNRIWYFKLGCGNSDQILMDAKSLPDGSDDITRVNIAQDRRQAGEKQLRLSNFRYVAEYALPPRANSKSGCLRRFSQAVVGLFCSPQVRSSNWKQGRSTERRKLTGNAKRDRLGRHQSAPKLHRCVSYSRGRYQESGRTLSHAARRSCATRLHAPSSIEAGLPTFSKPGTRTQVCPVACP